MVARFQRKAGCAAGPKFGSSVTLTNRPQRMVPADLVSGPSGKGVTDLYTPEIAYFNTTIINQIIAYGAPSYDLYGAHDTLCNCLLHGSCTTAESYNRELWIESNETVSCCGISKECPRRKRSSCPYWQHVDQPKVRRWKCMMLPAVDGLHTAALLNWIQGLGSSGTKKQPVPALMGANYQVRCLNFLVIVTLHPARM